MNKKELQEIERKQVFETGNEKDFIRVKDIQKLIAEVRRLNEERTEIIKEMDFAFSQAGRAEEENQRLKEEAKAIEGMKGYEDYLIVQRGLWDSQQENRLYKQALGEIQNVVGGMGARNLHHLKSHILGVIQKALKGEGE
jgi:vacuolar-type H+-ATPase subunit I/STV1